jgi:hypothetical protein
MGDPRHGGSCNAYVPVLVRIQGFCKNFHRFGAGLIGFIRFFKKPEIKDLTPKPL